jgi:hypothetical protein
MADVDANLADQRPGDRGAEEIRSLVAGLPLHDGKGEVATEFFANVHDFRLHGPAVARLLEDRLPILARLPEVDIHRHHLIALLDEPAEDHRRIQSA